MPAPVSVVVTGGRFPLRSAADAKRKVVVRLTGDGPKIPQLGEDESYFLAITPGSAVLTAKTPAGAARGQSTVAQLVGRDGKGWYLPCATIRDAPRFPWRGLLIDVGRHWMPMDVIERNLAGMALVKLNVLHLHLTEDQGFRIESRTHPELQEKGSDGRYFTQAQMRQIIREAAQRGIRVVPEFDIPGHATSWVVSHPELASAPGPYAIERHWGVFNPVLDPTNEAVYKLLDDFLGEMAELFPDPFVHIGGDENNGKQWNANPRIQAFIASHHLAGNAGLHAYFNQRVSAILARHGKRMVGWDEILNPALPRDTVIQSWRGASGVAKAAQMGFDVILSHGYYIDLIQPASEHYAIDPVSVSGRLGEASLPPEERRRVLGGEATMWSEWVTPETIDSRIWPRTAAIAERLWSPQSVNDTADMYRRLAIIDEKLAALGLKQHSYQPEIARQILGPNAPHTDRDLMLQFLQGIEPSPIQIRRKQQRDTRQSTPLDGLADASEPDNALGRKMLAHVEAWETNPTATNTRVVSDDFAALRDAADRVITELAPKYPSVNGLAALANEMKDATELALDRLGRGSNQPPQPADPNEIKARLDRDAAAQDAAQLTFIPALRRLLQPPPPIPPAPSP
jgi:hexosaminidase